MCPLVPFSSSLNVPIYQPVGNGMVDEFKELLHEMSEGALRMFLALVAENSSLRGEPCQSSPFADHQEADEISE